MSMSMKWLLPLGMCLMGCVRTPYHSRYNYANQHDQNLRDAIDRTVLNQENWMLMQDCLDDWHHECLVLMKP